MPIWEVGKTTGKHNERIMHLIAAKICEVDSEPDFRYEIKNGQLIYHAWLDLQQSTEEDSDGFIPKLVHDGQYLVIINAETGIVEDVVYDALLPGAG